LGGRHLKELTAKPPMLSAALCLEEPMLIARKESERTAFTLIELVTVMVILSIVAIVVAGPTLSLLDSMRSSAAAARLTADIRYTQRVALGSGLRTWVSFNATTEQYSLFVEDPANPGKANRVAAVNPLDLTTDAVQFGSGPFANVGISSVDINSTTELEFDSFGEPYDANGVALTSAATVVLTGNVAVQVSPVGGLVESVTWP
jgi:prepilin-type N-terminal cleavage/methylation domain-containing protein